MKWPPLSIILLVICQFLFGVLACAVTVMWPYAESMPGWFRIWFGIAALLHLVSAIALFRLRWWGPILFAVALLGALTTGELLTPTYAARSLAGTALALALAAVYGGVVSAYRRRFVPLRRPRH